MLRGATARRACRRKGSQTAMNQTQTGKKAFLHRLGAVACRAVPVAALVGAAAWTLLGGADAASQAAAALGAAVLALSLVLALCCQPRIR